MRSHALCAFSVFFATLVSMPAPESRADTKRDMNEVFFAVADILPMAYDARQFSSPGNDDRIRKGLDSLASATANLKHHKQAIPVDPFAKFLIREMQQDIKAAQSLFAKGDKEYARTLIREVSGYCIACHTSSGKGQRNYPSDIMADVSKLPHYDQANFYAATRNYSKAVEEYEFALLDEKLSKGDPENWGLGAKRLLAIIIRVQNDPFLALELVSRLREEKAITPSLEPASAQWRMAIKRWRDTEVLPGKSRMAPLDEARGLLKETDALAKQHGKPAALVEYLRISRLVNMVLEKPKRHADYIEALWIAGQAAEEIDDINFWILDTKYYETCVRLQPKGPFATRCFDRYKARVMARVKLENQGSDTVLPAKVEELRQLMGS